MENTSINSGDVVGIVLILFLIYKLYTYFKKREKANKYKVDRKSKPPPKPKIYTQEELDKLAIINRKEVEIAFNNYYQKLFEGKEFINKNALSLEEFTINDEINQYDIFKLAELNGIKVQTGAGWYDLVIELMQELNQLGWNKQVGSIKEKFGELRFYADTPHHDVIEKYTERSKKICEKCGKPGELRIEVWWITLCDEHYAERK
ncbi:MAG: hypothetical protein AB8B69_00445 [Chitinophagales bacterium]